MQSERPPALAAARDALKTHHPDALGAFVAGSVVAGIGTAGSDLDIVVLYPRLPNAYQHSLLHQGWPVDFMVQDPETLRYFFERERRNGVPTLPAMIAEGHRIGNAPVLQALHDRAQAFLAQGPAPLTDEIVDRMRFQITTLRDDLVDPRPEAERVAIAVALYEPLATLWLRHRGEWAGLGKHLARRLAESDVAFATRFSAALARAVSVDAAAWIGICDEVLDGVGGPLSTGHRMDAPPHWRG